MFAGSEYVVVNILKNERLRNRYDFHFAYRSHKDYEIELKRIFSEEERTCFHPLHLLPLGNPIIAYHKYFKWRPLRVIMRIPLILCEYLQIFNVYNYFVIKNLLQKVAPDLIHINNGGYPAAESCLVTSLSSRKLGYKNVMQINNIPSRWQKKFWDRIIRKSSDGFIVASEYTSKNLGEIRRITNNNVFTLRDNVKDATPNRLIEDVRKELGVTTKDVLLIEVALIENRKGQLELLQSLLKLRDKHVSFYERMKLLLVGTGPNEEKAKNFVKENNLDGKVIFYGFRNDYVDYLNAADVAVLPSLYNEDMPLINLTAMSLAKPIVSTYVAGIPEEVENGVTGVLLHPEEENFVENLADALVLGYEKRKEFGLKGRERFEREFSKESYTQGLINIYEALLPKN